MIINLTILLLLLYNNSRSARTRLDHAPVGPEDADRAPQQEDVAPPRPRHGANVAGADKPGDGDAGDDDVEKQAEEVEVRHAEGKVVGGGAGEVLLGVHAEGALSGGVYEEPSGALCHWIKGQDSYASFGVVQPERSITAREKTDRLLHLHITWKGHLIRTGQQILRYTFYRY